MSSANSACDRRDEVMRRMGILLEEVPQEAGYLPEKAREFGAEMELAIGGYVKKIEASDSGTAGTA
jgi:hypothetical protein